MQPPDLLEPTPRLRLDPRLFSETLTFAFATGSSPEAFERVLKSFDPGRSSFDPELFARDLFVKDLVARCLCKGSEKRDRYPLLQRPLLAVLMHPTCNERTLAHRHQVLRALLDSPELTRSLEQCLAEVRYLFDLFQGSERVRHGAAVVRRLDILRALRNTVDKLERAFQGAAGPLSRVHAFASSVQASDGWSHLSSLLDYESNLATVDLRLRLGHDGE